MFSKREVILLLASGSEKLKWGNQSWILKGEGDVAHLPAGHAIDFAGGVRYGIIGEPVARLPFDLDD